MHPLQCERPVRYRAVARRGQNDAAWPKFLPVPLYSVLLLLCGVVLPPIAQYLIALGNETPFSWDPLFHSVVFGLCFGMAAVLYALTRISVPIEDPTDALNRFAEYLVSDIPNLKKIAE